MIAGLPLAADPGLLLQSMGFLLRSAHGDAMELGNWRLNNNYQYGIGTALNPSGDGTSPQLAATGLTQGELVSIAYQSGTASAGLPANPLVNADGDQTWITGVNIWNGTYFPTLYTTASSYPLGQPITFNAIVTNGQECLCHTSL